MLALVLTPVAIAAFLAWHWDALGSRAWPTDVRRLAFTDDGRALVLLDERGVLHLVDLDNPLDVRHGSCRSVATRAEWIVRAFSPDRVLVGHGWRRAETLSVSLRAGRATSLGAFGVLGASTDADLLLAREQSDDGALDTVRRLSNPGEVLWSVAPDSGWTRHPSVLSPDARTVATLTEGGVALREARTGRVLASFARGNSPWWAGFDGSGDLLACDGLGMVERYRSDGSRRQGGELPLMGIRDVAAEGLRLVTFMSHGRSLAEVRDSVTGKVLISIQCDLGALSRDGAWFAAIGDEGRPVIVRVPDDSRLDPRTAGR